MCQSRWFSKRQVPIKLRDPHNHTWLSASCDEKKIECISPSISNGHVCERMNQRVTRKTTSAGLFNLLPIQQEMPDRRMPDRRNPKRNVRTSKVKQEGGGVGSSGPAATVHATSIFLLLASTFIVVLLLARVVTQMQPMQEPADAAVYAADAADAYAADAADAADAAADGTGKKPASEQMQQPVQKVENGISTMVSTFTNICTFTTSVVMIAQKFMERQIYESRDY
jgi:hypothetical protein